MKKVFSLLAVLALVCMVSSSVFAALATKSAYAKFDDVALSFSVKIFDWVSGTAWDSYSTEADDITFTLTGVTPGVATPAWAPAKTFAKVSSNLTTQSAATKVLMYTDNTNATLAGDFKANAPRSEEVSEGVYKNKYNGLVRKGNTSTYQAGDYAPLEIKCVEKAKATSYITTLPAEFNNAGKLDVGERYVVDKSDEDFNADSEEGVYIGKGGPDGGIWCGAGTPDGGSYGNWYSKTDDVIIFFGARFSNVLGGAEYGTKVIKFAQTVE